MDHHLVDNSNLFKPRPLHWGFVGTHTIKQDLSDEEYFEAASQLRLEELAISIELFERGVK